MFERLIDIEYMPNGGKLEYVRKRGQIYIGVGRRASDGFTVLKVRAPGAKKNHNIEVGAVYAITLDGARHVLETPNMAWRIRAQEISRLVDGQFTEEWAAEYFEPASPKYFKRRADYEPEIDTALEAAFTDPSRKCAVPSGPNAISAGIPPPTPTPFLDFIGAAIMLTILVLIFI